MSQSAKGVEYPRSALIAFYETAKSYEARLECIMRDYYQENIKYSDYQKETVIDAFLTARTICQTVDGYGLLDGDQKGEVIVISVITAKVLAQLLKGLSEYQIKLVSAGIDVDLVH